MTKSLKALAAAAALTAAGAASATPSTTVWTPATTYTQPYLVPHLTYDTYVAEKGMLQNTYGLTVGVIPGDKVQGEVGFDVFYPGFTGDYLQLNGKVTVAENLVGAWSPALSVGIANAGFEKDVSDYDLLHATLGKTLPVGTLGIGGYYGAGSALLWTGSGGAVSRGGFMASYVSPDIKVALPGLEKVVLSADYASGKNWFGAVAAAASFYFTSNVSLLTGPVFFLDTDLYKRAYGSDFMWTAQLDVDIPFKK
ncbi:MAG TPA: hypothetical protein VF841_04665 [Anaeromyxobacter sp.]